MRFIIQFGTMCFPSLIIVKLYYVNYLYYLPERYKDTKYGIVHLNRINQ